MSDDDPPEPASSSLPIATGDDGQAYIAADAVVAFLRSIAASCRNLVDDPDCDLTTLAETLDIEADNLDCRAIERTM